MMNGNDTPAAATPTDRQFAVALQIFEGARRGYGEAKAALAAGQHDQADAINALPEQQRADMAQLEGVGDQIQIGAKGEDAFVAMETADAALTALMAIPATTPAMLAAKVEAHFSAPWETGDHSTILVADAERVAAIASRSTPEWDEALSAYREAVGPYANSVGAAETEASLNRLAEAEDHLVLKVPAPSADALLLKVRLALRRWKLFKFPDDVADAMLADVDRLYPMEAGHAA